MVTDVIYSLTNKLQILYGLFIALPVILHVMFAILHIHRTFGIMFILKMKYERHCRGANFND